MKRHPNKYSSPTSTCVKRLQRELASIVAYEKSLKSESTDDKSEQTASSAADTAPTVAEEGETKGQSAFVSARPSNENILTWYFIIAGPDASPYAGGRYVGELHFPNNYPMAPPEVFMLTPSGRYATDKKLCMSNTSYHPESWSPVWNIQTIVIGLASMMLTNDHAIGSVSESTSTRRSLATKSHSFNTTNLRRILEELFPEQLESELREVERLSGSGDKNSAGPDAGTPAVMPIISAEEKVSPSPKRRRGSGGSAAKKSRGK